MFQRYYHELCEALSGCPEQIAEVLYSNELVTRQERNRAVDTLGYTSYTKAETLVRAVEGRIVTENSADPLRKFCQVLRRHCEVGGIVSRMKFRLGEERK